MAATKFWRMCTVGTFCAALTVVAFAATWQSFSEDSDVNDGKWNARIDGDAKTARQGRVVIADFAGEWREVGPRRDGDPCRGTKPFPITVQRSNDNQLEFTAWAAKVSKCPDFALTLKVVDQSTLVGTTGDGREVRLTREPVQGKAKR